jgi:hypothetical protein
MIAQLIDVRNLFGIKDTEKSDGEVGAAIGYASQQISKTIGRVLDGQAKREYIGTSDGKTVDFLTGFPILDKLQTTGGMFTTDSSKITIESRTPGESSYSAVSESNYSINGEQGWLIFSTLPDEGADIYATYYYDAFKARQVEATLAAYQLISQDVSAKDRAAIIYSQYIQLMAGRPFYTTISPLPNQPSIPRQF